MQKHETQLLFFSRTQYEKILATINKYKPEIIKLTSEVVAEMLFGK